jgi:hypothetical protein
MSMPSLTGPTIRLSPSRGLSRPTASKSAVEAVFLWSDDVAEIQRIPRTLRDNEAVIKRGLTQVWEVAAALADIREQKQYLEAGHKTFDEYCETRWNFTRQYATSLIRGVSVVENLNDNMNKTETRVSVLPHQEAQTRAIREATKDPQEQAEVWTQAVEDAGGEQPTAPQIKQAAAKVTASKTAPPPAEEPEPAKLCDDFGPLAIHLVPLWSTLAEAKEAEKKVRDLEKAIKELAKKPVGSRINTTPVNSAIAAIKQALKLGVPFTECFKCQRKTQQDCNLCRGSGWINESEYSGRRTEGGDRWLRGRE